jgi:hypothetical protein
MYVISIIYITDGHVPDGGARRARAHSGAAAAAAPNGEPQGLSK